VAARAAPGDALFFAPPWAQAPFLIQYHGPELQLHGARSFVGYYHEQGHPFDPATFETAALREQLATGDRAWIVWDRIYGARPSIPAGCSVEEQRYGTTTLLLVSPC
jgi:hypothetical protein